MEKEIAVALISGLVSIIAAILTYISKRNEKVSKQKLAQAELEMTVQSDALDFGQFFQDWNFIQNEINELMESTNVDRFLMFRAWNGARDPRWTTAVYQLRQGEQKPVSYVHFELDNDYKHRLNDMIESNKIYFEVEDLPDSAIRSVYKAEGVASAVWCHLDSSRPKDINGKSITYCSFASHDPHLIDEHTQTRCKIVADRMKSVIENFK